MVVLLTAGHRHEQLMLAMAMERGAVKRPGRGRPRIRPNRVAGDKGDSSPVIRRYLDARNRIGHPDQGQGGPNPTFDRAAYHERNVLERLINRLKQWRRVATRYEKRAPNYLAMVTLAAILLWLWATGRAVAASAGRTFVPWFLVCPVDRHDILMTTGKPWHDRTS